jgi:cytochrome c oxidase subunit I+III
MTALDERTGALDPRVAHELEDVWEDRPGLLGFFTSVDHKRVGIRYIVTSFAFFFVAGLMALGMRAQLAEPNGKVLGPEAYNQLFTMHGTTMIFLFNTPVLAGFGNYLLPLMIGARDMAFPRLNAFSYWIFLLSGVFMYSSFLLGAAPDGGWFAYTPLSDRAFSPGINLDFWGLGVMFVGISSTAGAVNFVVTTLKMRAPGMTLNRLPIFVWSLLGMALMILFAFPAVTVSAALLEADRLFHTAFYVPAAGGNVLLYQHLFWFWGHPEVYILFLPAAGMVSTMVPVFARRALAGYVWVAASLVAIGFISFGVWVHHMFATGLPAQAMGFFSAASLVIVLPSAVQYFALVATMWGRRIAFEPPMLFALGFLVIFLLGGITGVMVAAIPVDLQVTDSYFVVAHFHYVLNGAVVFPIFGAIAYWLPKMTGRMLNRRAGVISFWLMFVGFNVTFFPMHLLGIMGMPRRVFTYDAGLGWGTLNLIVSIGSLVFAGGTGVMLGNALWSLWRGAPAGPDPWGADSLEWSVSSPPPEHNFAAIPVVTSRHPMWDGPVPTAARDAQPSTLTLEGARARESLITTELDAVPETGLDIPAPTALPLLCAVGVAVLFVGLLVSATVVLFLGVGVALVGVAMWTWRTDTDLR